MSQLCHSIGELRRNELGIACPELNGQRFCAYAHVKAVLANSSTVYLPTVIGDVGGVAALDVVCQVQSCYMCNKIESDLLKLGSNHGRWYCCVHKQYDNGKIVTSSLRGFQRRPKPILKKKQEKGD